MREEKNLLKTKSRCYKPPSIARAVKEATKSRAHVLPAVFLIANLTRHFVSMVIYSQLIAMVISYYPKEIKRTTNVHYLNMFKRVKGL